MGKHSLPAVGPSGRRLVYVAAAALGAVWAVAYVVLAVAAPEAAERLLAAPGALAAVLPGLVAAFVGAMAAAHTDTGTESGAPAGEVARGDAIG